MRKLPMIAWLPAAWLAATLAALPVPARSGDSPRLYPPLQDWLPQLHKGMWVKVEGQLQPTGGLLAHEFKIRAGDPDEAEITTAIVSVDAQAKSFRTRLGAEIETNHRTEFQSKAGRPNFASLAAGTRVEVSVTVQKKGKLLAEDVEIKNPDKIKNPDEDEITGRIESVDVQARKIVLLGIPVFLDDNTKNKTPLVE